MSRYYRDPLSEHMPTHNHDLQSGSMNEPAGGDTFEERERNKPKKPADEVFRPSHVLGWEKNAPAPTATGAGTGTGTGTETNVDEAQPIAAASQPPRVFPTSGFQIIDPSDKVEEEKLPFYERDEYYPMHMSEVIGGHYQVVAKLGYGTTSTVWLGRDLSQCHTNLDDYPGRQHVRELHDSFTLTSQHGDREVFVMTPLGMSLRTLEEIQSKRVFQKVLVTSSLDQVLVGLDYLHSAKVVHTDLHSDNLLVAITDDSILTKVEEGEILEPAGRKQDDDRFIYVSQYMLGGAGPLTICDFGQARIGSVHTGPAMPLPY
ncbi:hypothetical protein VTG60DRAFT_1450 [Thermothelomyces hinnuleus]